MANNPTELQFRIPKNPEAPKPETQNNIETSFDNLEVDSRKLGGELGRLAEGKPRAGSEVIDGRTVQNPERLTYDQELVELRRYGVNLEAMRENALKGESDTNPSPLSTNRAMSFEETHGEAA